jgi:hypothetical protein
VEDVHWSPRLATNGTLRRAQRGNFGIEEDPKALPLFMPWNSEGFIPPIGSSGSTSHDRSPYIITLRDLVEDFGYTPTRQRLLSGFLSYRARLHQMGLTTGFQWINGSFLENVEENDSRGPEDIDVVTFFHLPSGYTEETLLDADQPVFNRNYIKSKYEVDAHYVQLNAEHMGYVIESSTYWYSLWSHTRDGQWKGYLQVDLANVEDETARTEIGKGVEEGGQP